MRESTEHSSCSSTTERYYETNLLGTLNVKDFDDRSCSGNSKFNNLLVNLFGVARGFSEEHAVGDELQSCLLRRRIRVNKQTLVDEITTHRGSRLSGACQVGRGSECLDTVDIVAGSWSIEVLAFNSMFVAWTINSADTRLTCIDINCVVYRLHVQSNLLDLVFSGIRRNFGSIEGGDVGDDGLDIFGLEVYVVNAEFIVEPVDLIVDKLWWDPTAFFNETLNCDLSVAA